MNITGHQTILKKCLLSNPNNDNIINALVKPKMGISFTFDIQKSNSIMVFAVHITYQLIYTSNVDFIFECYDGTVFDSDTEVPQPKLLLPTVKKSIGRINDVLLKKLFENKIYLEKNEGIWFSNSEILNLLDADIHDAYFI